MKRYEVDNSCKRAKHGKGKTSFLLLLKKLNSKTYWKARLKQLINNSLLKDWVIQL